MSKSPGNPSLKHAPAKPDQLKPAAAPPFRSVQRATFGEDPTTVINQTATDAQIRRASKATTIANLAGGRKYKDVEFLGAGGMAEVYIAKDVALDRKVVIKCLNSDFETDREMLIRFEKEGRSASKIRHPNIVEIYTVEKDDAQRPYIVMEYLIGGDLSNHIQPTTWPPTLEFVLEVAIQLFDALEAARQANIIHRDIKPANLMIVDKQGAPLLKVLDFGIAKDQSSTDPKQTMTRAIFGSPEYMSPEQRVGGGLDHRSDIYGAAVTIYELLTTMVPFDCNLLETDDIDQRNAKIQSTHARALSQLPPKPSQTLLDLRATASTVDGGHITSAEYGIPEGYTINGELEGIIMNCLAVNATHRPQTAGNVADLLRKLKNDLTNGPTTKPEDTVSQVTPSLVLGEYVLTNRVKLATGEYVYHATKPGLGGTFTLRTATNGVCSPETFVRMEREAMLARLSEHPNLVRITDTGKTDQLTYLVTESMGDEASLEAICRRKTPNESDAKILFTGIATGLAAMHSERVLHRNLNPHNIYLVTAVGGGKVAKIGDLRYAQVPDPERTGGKITVSAMSIGKGPYVAPEIHFGIIHSPASDIYALGVMMYEYWSGELPVKPNPRITINPFLRTIDQPIQKPSQINPKVPAKWDDIILRCLAFKAQGRFRTAQDLRLAIDADQEVLKPIDPRENTVLLNLPKPGRKKIVGGVAALAFGAILSGVIATVGIAKRPTRPEIRAPLVEPVFPDSGTTNRASVSVDAGVVRVDTSRSTSTTPVLVQTPTYNVRFNAEFRQFTVYVDGGQSPLCESERNKVCNGNLSAGEHRLVVKRNGYQDWQRTVMVNTANQIVEIGELVRIIRSGPMNPRVRSGQRRRDAGAPAPIVGGVEE